LAKYYLTTAIDYATADPHQGHAFEKIGADAIARYHRLKGDDVHFLIGMDEHGQKVAQTAAERKFSPQELVDAVAESTREIWSKVGISYDQFIRTTDPAHKAGVKRLIEQIFENSPDDFYEKAYEGWYCVGCEAFKQDDEIVDGKCILHPTRVLEWVEEKNWFFRLSAYTDRIRKLVSSEEFLQPKSRRNEILSLLDSGLEDISASRSRFSWGVPFPRKTSAGGGADDVCLVRCAAELSDRDWFPKPRLRAALAGRPAPYRQGHHPLSRCDLAGDADGSRNRLAQAHLGTRFRARRRVSREQVSGWQPQFA